MRWVLYMSLRTEFSELNRELFNLHVEYSVSGVVPSERQPLDPIELLLWIGPNYCMVGLLRARYRCSSGMLPIHSSIKLLYTYVVSTITVCTCSTYHNKGYICRRVVTVLLDLMLICLHR